MSELQEELSCECSENFTAKIELKETKLRIQVNAFTENKTH